MKLVRDHIPEIIQADGKWCLCRRANGTDEHMVWLKEKIVEEAQEFIELVTQIKTFKLLRTDDQDISPTFSNWTHTYVKENKLVELIQVREDETTVYFYASQSDQDHIVDELVMLVQEEGEVSDNPEIAPQTVVLLIQGSIDLYRIASLTQKLDLPAGEELKKLKNQVRI